MITLLLLTPIIGCLLLILIDEDSENSEFKMKNIALITSLINFLISIYFWIQFDSSTTHYQFVYEFNQLNFCHFNIGIDGISLYFVLLTTFITPIALLSNYTNIKNNIKYFLISFLLLETLQILAFIVLDLLLFYIYFESVLPIIFIVIVLFGHGKDRFRSAYLLFLYTLAGSLPMLLSILVIYNYLGSTDFSLLSLYEINLDNQKLLWLSLSFSKKDMTSRIINKNLTTLNLLNRLLRSNKNYLYSNNKNKEVVIYGSNLSSIINYPRYTSIIRHMVKIPFYLESTIVGIIISDAHCFINKSGYISLAFNQSIKYFEFFRIIFLKLSHYCQGYPKLDYTKINNKNFWGIIIITRVYSCLTKFYKLFYINKIKVVPLDLYNLLSYEALANWFMCDGTKHGKDFTLQTQSFTIKENIYNINILKHKFNYLLNKDKYLKNFNLLFLLNLFNIEIPNSNEPILGFAFSVFILLLIALVSFINILGYFFAIYLLNNNNFKNKNSKYTRIIKILQYFEKSSLFIIGIEIFFVLASLIFLIILSLIILGIIIL